MINSIKIIIKMQKVGFEPTNPKDKILSLTRLTTLQPLSLFLIKDQRILFLKKFNNNNRIIIF